ncbi:hypothetical protein HPB47_001300, partial [Ixodes persulcatus]
ASAEPSAEYVRAMQELLQIADPNDTNQEQVERVVRQAHPTFSRCLRGRPFGSLSELAQEARRVQADILAERRYHLPPAPTDTLDPRYAWHGPAAMAAASGETSGNPWELTDDALEPGSCRGWSTAVHATEFRPTGAPWIAAAQEQTAADPLPQKVPAAGSRGTGRQPDDKDRGDVDDAGGEPAAAHLLECPSMGQQLQVAADTRADRVPYPFRGYTVTETDFVAPEADAQPDVDAVYCEVCGGFVVLEQQHVLFINHCAQRVPGVDAVLARVRRDPEFAARLGTALPAAIGAAAPQASGDLIYLSEDDQKDL